MATKTIPTKKVIYIGDYIREEPLGRGSFASVYKGRHKISDHVVAIKDIYVEKMPEKNLESEIAIMRKINHSCIVKLIDCIRTTSHVYLVMEYCSMGDLNTYLQDNCYRKGMSESDLVHFLSQMASALKYLRQRNFVHRDIKPQNILLVPSNNGSHLPNIKISDFGFAKFLPNTSLTSSFCGTPLYMAPEVLARKSYDAKADLWSLGALLYEMMMGHKLCETTQMIELEDFFLKYDNQVDFSTAQHVFTAELKDLISVLLKKNPIDRASCEDFFHHVALLKNSRLLSFNHHSTQVVENDNDEEEEYVVVIDIKKSHSSSELPTKYTYSTSAPHQRINYNEFESPMLRDRKFSVGSAGSVLTKALSKASTRIFGNSNSNSNSGNSSNGPPSPTIPITPPIQEEESLSNQTLVIEEITLRKLLVSYTDEASAAVTAAAAAVIINKDPDEHRKFITKMERMVEMIDAVKSFADDKTKQADRSPFDVILPEEAMILYFKVTSLLRIGIKQIKSYQDKQSGIIVGMTRLNFLHDTMERKLKTNTSRAYDMSERCELDYDMKSDISIEKLLYDKALELSRTAAVQQLIKEELKQCVNKYQQSVYLLEAILNVEKLSKVINSEDKIIIKNFIESICTRVAQVQTNNKKL